MVQKHNKEHLTLEQRLIIQTGIINGSEKNSIAQTIRKDATTVAKEIRKHRTLHSEKTSESMAATLDNLRNKLPEPIFRQLFPVILTDRGTEFEKTELFEFDKETGEKRLNIFYCDPQRSSQKPNVECNHNYVRDVIPNAYYLNRLTQEDLKLMFSHINSTPRAFIMCFIYDMCDIFLSDSFENSISHFLIN